MFRAAFKSPALPLAAVVAAASVTVGYVHHMQVDEKDRMSAGVRQERAMDLAELRASIKESKARKKAEPK